ncbi:MAG: GspH/FimT family pseudopilin [Acidobacteria bacterium]|nr:GspH/FimT family pseudopilin [Acidobacteriota bacterium]MBI3662569.1 GspH/FimT family pseudopilin [Acidobacteriota bacterium]
MRSASSPGRQETIRSSPGFSLVELLIVVGILLVLSAFAFPTVTRSIRTYRLSGAATNVSSMLQLTRFEAVRLNRSNPPLSWRSQLQGGQSVFWVDVNNNGALDSTEPQARFSLEMQFLPAGTAPSVTSMGYASTQISPAAISFDSRGTVSFGVAPPVVYVLVLGYANQPAEGYRAVTVTPSGKTQMWSAGADGVWQKR